MFSCTCMWVVETPKAVLNHRTVVQLPATVVQLHVAYAKISCDCHTIACDHCMIAWDLLGTFCLLIGIPKKIIAAKCLAPHFQSTITDAPHNMD